MATFDDKLLGEKLDYYCSSSEDEDDGPKVECQLFNFSSLVSNFSKKQCQKLHSEIPCTDMTLAPLFGKAEFISWV